MEAGTMPGTCLVSPKALTTGCSLTVYLCDETKDLPAFVRGTRNKNFRFVCHEPGPRKSVKYLSGLNQGQKEKNKEILCRQIGDVLLLQLTKTV
jgi:hypothetical protein